MHIVAEMFADDAIQQPVASTGTRGRTRPRRRRAPKQLALPKAGLVKRKYRRKDAASRRSTVAHTSRPQHQGRHPVHVTLRLKHGLPSLRQQRLLRLFAEVLQAQRKRAYRDDFRVVHFSLQATHVHLVIEANSENGVTSGRKGYAPLRAGVSGLAIAFARRLNMMLKRNGKVWDDRYHRHDLKTPTETHRAFAYVFKNFLHHGEAGWGKGITDPFSSAWLFEGWADVIRPYRPSKDWAWPVCRAQTWLASRGYLRIGRLALHG